MKTLAYCLRALLIPPCLALGLALACQIWAGYIRHENAKDRGSESLPEALVEEMERHLEERTER